jgi:hypothetical protein
MRSRRTAGEGSHRCGDIDEKRRRDEFDNYVM